MAERGIAHGFEHETLEAKIAWFATLSPCERLEVFEEMYELAVALNPKLRGGREIDFATTSVRILELPER